MPTTLLALTSLRPGGDGALHRYLEVVGPLMQTAGARLINRYEVKRTLSGSDLPEVVSIIEYPDTEAVRRVFEAAEYRGQGAPKFFGEEFSSAGQDRGGTNRAALAGQPKLSFLSLPPVPGPDQGTLPQA
ncbi:MAG: hypothetical protein B7Z10_09960 [Rhodobacterales bacterium 32-66-7]|nr:MAG: hypothetical protein B7Z10_09960 [Rhodobacterales bacterium 32-66-7]